MLASVSIGAVGCGVVDIYGSGSGIMNDSAPWTSVMDITQHESTAVAAHCWHHMGTPISHGANFPIYPTTPGHPAQ